MSGVRLERDGPIAVLRLDKARGNAIDEPLVEALAAAAAELARDPEVRGVLLASAHPKLFCPGLDLVALAEYDRPSGRSTACRNPWSPPSRAPPSPEAASWP